MATVVLDNGAYSAKIGYITEVIPRVVPNCVIKAKTVRNRIFIGDQIDECKDLSGLYYLLPFQKGYLVNWDVERQVWEHMFGKNGIQVNFDESGVIMTEPYLNFRSVQEAVDEIFFEEYQVPFFLRCNPSYLSQYKQQKEVENPCCVIVDSGYSFTHIAPYFKGKPLKQLLRRIDIGGKILTNHLKEVISYRQLMVMEETHVINQMKEDACFVSQDFFKDMEIARKKGPENTIACDYVLPDYTNVKRGHIKKPDSWYDTSQQMIRMCNERFAIPELLFHPSDVGVNEMGISEAVVHVISLAPEKLQPFLYQNIVLTGGNCCLPGFRDRVYKDVRALAPDEFEISVKIANDPTLASWEGGCHLGNSADLLNLIVTKDQYEEYGPNICRKMFVF